LLRRLVRRLSSHVSSQEPDVRRMMRKIKKHPAKEGRDSKGWVIAHDFVSWTNEEEEEITQFYSGMGSPAKTRSFSETSQNYGNEKGGGL